MTEIKVEFGEFIILLEVSDNPELFANKLVSSHNFDFTEEVDIKEYKGFVKKHYHNIAFFLKTDYSEADFVHELFHATYRMLNNISIPLNDETEEVYARYQDMLYRLIKPELDKLKNA